MPDNRPSLAKLFFDNIQAHTNKFSFIRSWINSSPPTIETDHLDFKTHPGNENKLKEMWYEALSGFANSGGGVLVWGIDARQDPVSQVDCACGEKLIQNPHAFKSRLVELQRGATDPPLGSVLIDVYESPSDATLGFVVCLVPEGKTKPYRAEISGKPNYFQRAGDSFHILGRSLLRALFYPQSQAVFRVMAFVKWDYATDNSQVGSGGRDRRISISCSTRLRNIGSATARNMAVRSKNNASTERLDDFSAEGFWWSRYPYSAEDIRFEARRPLHPDEDRGLYNSTWLVPAIIAEDHRVVPNSQDISLAFAIFAENQNQQQVELEITSETLVARKHGIWIETAGTSQADG